LIEQTDLEQYIVNATCEVFSTMVFLDIEPGDLQVGDAVSIDSDLSSLIGLAGDFRGIVGIHCSDKAAKGITGGMLGMEVEELDDDVQDAIGEIANMVAGGLKESFAGVDVDVQLAIPTTVIGKALKTSSLPGGVRIMVPFALPEGVVGVELKYIMS